LDACVPLFIPHPGGRDTFAANSLQLISAGFLAAAYLLFQSTKRLTDSFVIRYLPFCVTAPLWNAMYTIAKGEMIWDLGRIFDGNNFWWSCGIGLFEICIILLYFKLLCYIDVLSIGGLFAAKSIILPVILNLANAETASKDPFWTPWLWFTAPINIVICSVLVFFASKRRQAQTRKVGDVSPSHVRERERERKEKGRGAPGRTASPTAASRKAQQSRAPYPTRSAINSGRDQKAKKAKQWL
jgi:hypothetical protein